MRVLTEGALVPKLLLDVLDWEPVKKDRKNGYLILCSYFFFSFCEKRKTGEIFKKQDD